MLVNLYVQGTARLKVNGKAVSLAKCARKSYARIRRTWTRHDKIEIEMPMPVERVEAHPLVVANTGRTALQRGPLVYCLEETDNCRNLANVRLPGDAKMKVTRNRKLLGDVCTISARAMIPVTDRQQGDLYAQGPTRKKAFTMRAVPYYSWANRLVGEMIVWLRR